ncbi:MAG: hypothetical protein M3R08_02090 [Bacteroidota bacterium]|nr:hypothetical protein [Bacteroidota bacterium]
MQSLIRSGVVRAVLLELGIDSISVTPDSLLKTIKAIHKLKRAWLKNARL